jgi:hypothetical protein
MVYRKPVHCFYHKTTPILMVNLTLFSQLLQLLPRDSFRSLVNEYQSDKSSKGITSWTHLVSMLFCQFGHLNSVRDIPRGLCSIAGNASHLGITKVPSKSSVSYINQNRDWELFRDYYYAALDHFQQQYHFGRKGLPRLKRKVFLVDASVIPLCLSLFDWAQYRKKKGAIKLHTVLDYDGCLPVFASVTEGKTHEVNVVRELSFPTGSVVVFDRGYIDYEWMNELDSSGVFFVTRMKTNAAYKVNKVFLDKPEADGVRFDADISFWTASSQKKYPGKIRLVRYWDAEQQKELEFITNNPHWKAQTVADVYRERWNIEVFFKQIKQNLKIKSFIGTSVNAVMIQLWTAMLSMLLLIVMKSRAKYQWNLSNMVVFLRLNLLVKVDLWGWLDDPFFRPPEKADSAQVRLF